MNVVEQALKIRRDMNTASATLTDTEGIDLIGLFEPWTLKDYAVGDRFRYENKLYKVIQAHTSQTVYMSKPTETEVLRKRVTELETEKAALEKQVKSK